MANHDFFAVLRGNQTTTGSNRVDKQHFQTPQFPGPQTPSQQFSVQAGAQVLGNDEQRALDRIVARMKRRREGPVSSSGMSGFGKAFGF